MVFLRPELNPMSYFTEESPPKKRRLNSNVSTEVILIGPQLEESPISSATPESVAESLNTSVGVSNVSPAKQEIETNPVASVAEAKDSAPVPSTSAVRCDDTKSTGRTSTSGTSSSSSDNEFKEENEFERKLLKKIELSVLILLDYFKEEKPARSSLLETPPKSRHNSESSQSLGEGGSTSILPSSYSTVPVPTPPDQLIVSTVTDDKEKPVDGNYKKEDNSMGNE